MLSELLILANGALIESVENDPNFHLLVEGECFYMRIAAFQ